MTASGEPIEGLMEKGLRYLTDGRPGQARRLFEEVLGRIPSHVAARTRLAETYLAERDYERAAAEAEAVLAAEPHHVRALIITAECYRAAGDAARAGSAADRAARAFHWQVRRGEGTQEDLVSLIRAYARLEDDRSLSVLARRYVRGTPADWDGLTLAQLGVASWNVGRLADARWLWRRAACDPFWRNVIPVFLHALDLVEQQAIPAFRMDYRLGRDDAVGVGKGPGGSTKAFSLWTLWNSSDHGAREAALDLLAQAETPWAEPFLFAFLCRADMPDPLKLRASGWLLERGYLRPNTPVVMHLEGELREVTISAGPRPPASGSDPGGAGAPSADKGRARRLLRPADAGGRIAGSRRRRGRRARVEPGMSWEAGLETYSKSHLLTMARGFGLRGVSRLAKGEIAAAVAQWLREHWAELFEMLEPDDQGLLRFLAQHGGAVPVERLGEWTAAFAVRRDGRDNGSPFTALPPELRLQALGFLFIGPTGEDRTGPDMAVIPPEVRNALAAGADPVH